MENMSANVNKRVYWIDAMKFICMFFVMFNHWEGCPNYLRNLFNPFFLVGFYFCSGYCIKIKSSYHDFVIKRVKQLLIPWFIFSNLNIILSSIISFNEHEDLFTEIIRNLFQIRTYGDRLWFIACMFTVSLFIYPVLQKINGDEKKLNISLIICFLIYMLREVYAFTFPVDLMPWASRYLPWHLDKVPVACFYMLLGYGYKNYWEDKFNISNHIVNAVLLIGYIIFIQYNLQSKSSSFVYSIADDFIRSNLGLYLLIYFSKLMRFSNFVEYIGSNTLVVFSIHNKVQTFLEFLFSKFTNSFYSAVISNNIYATLFGTIFVLCAMIILIPFIYIINKYFPWSIGRKANKSIQS